MVSLVKDSISNVELVINFYHKMEISSKNRKALVAHPISDSENEIEEECDPPVHVKQWSTNRKVWMQGKIYISQSSLRGFVGRIWMEDQGLQLELILTAALQFLTILSVQSWKEF